MARFMKKQITCRCCGHTYEADVLMGLTTDRRVMDLDTNPHDPAVYRQVVQCPACGYAGGYAAAGYDRDVEERIKALVRGEEYRAMAGSPSEDRTAAALRCAEYLAEKTGNYQDASYYALLLLWWWKQYGSDEAGLKKVRDRAIRHFEEYLMDHFDLNGAMILIDLLRQAKRWDVALQDLSSLEPYIKDNQPLQRVAAFEKRLIHEEDHADHKLSEVDV